jgi:hypothetical protein
MTLCPIALVAGCQRCPLFTVCPLKTFVGDQGGKTEPTPTHPDEPDEGNADRQSS